MSDQTAPAPQAAAIAAHKSILAVASGKGGVGKTWCAISLAQALAKSGQRVLLFDGDLGLANVDVQLGLTPSRDIAQVVTGRASLGQVVERYEAGGFDIIAGRSGSAALTSLPPARLAEITGGLARLADHYDRVILDLGAGADRTVRQLAEGAGTILVVTTEDPTALTDAYAFIKLTRAQRPDLDFRVAINLAHDHAHGEKTYEKLKKVCENFLKFSPRLAGIIRQDRKVVDTIRAQTPILTRSPTSDAAADIEKLARALGP